MQIGSTAWLIQQYLNFYSLFHHFQPLGGLDVLYTKKLFHTEVIESWRGEAWTEQLELSGIAKSGDIQSLPVSLALFLLSITKYPKFFGNKQEMII